MYIFNSTGYSQYLQIFGQIVGHTSAINCKNKIFAYKIL